MVRRGAQRRQPPDDVCAARICPRRLTLTTTPRRFTSSAISTIRLPNAGPVRRPVVERRMADRTDESRPRIEIGHLSIRNSMASSTCEDQMKALLTGASSFTGLWFARALAERGIEVVAPLRGGLDSYSNSARHGCGNFRKVAQRRPRSNSVRRNFSNIGSHGLRHPVPPCRPSRGLSQRRTSTSTRSLRRTLGDSSP